MHQLQLFILIKYALLLFLYSLIYVTQILTLEIDMIHVDKDFISS